MKINWVYSLILLVINNDECRYKQKMIVDILKKIFKG